MLSSMISSQWYFNASLFPKDSASYQNVTTLSTVSLTNICGFSVMTGGGTETKMMNYRHAAVANGNTRHGWVVGTNYSLSNFFDSLWSLNQTHVYYCHNIHVYCIHSHICT